MIIDHFLTDNFWMDIRRKMHKAKPKTEQDYIDFMYENFCVCNYEKIKEGQEQGHYRQGLCTFHGKLFDEAIRRTEKRLQK